MENVEKRIKKIDADMKNLVQDALQKKKAKDTRGKKRVVGLMHDRCDIRIKEEENARERNR